MDVSGGEESLLQGVPIYDRKKELKAFDDTKAGVKGLIDAGLTKIPKMFIRPEEELDKEARNQVHSIQVPVIDLSGINRADRRKEIVDEVRIAAGKWGFFQLVNHGIPLTVLEGMIEGARLFHEQDLEEKKKFYTRDHSKKVRFTSNFDLFRSKSANWRDTLSISVHGDFDSTQLPDLCRGSVMEYAKYIEKLGDTLFEILSEAVGLKSDHLKMMECSDGFRLHCHYYPACPEPDLTLGITKHSDLGFLTVLLQNQISGLQVLVDGQWIDIHPVPRGLVVNIGDLLQMVSNDKFKSNKHRVLANVVGPRISVACFFSGPIHASKPKLYGPIKELISDENPPLYRDVLLKDYMLKFLSTGLDDGFGFTSYKI